MKKIDKEELHRIFIGIKNGKEEEFNELYQKYKDLVYGVSFSILKNREDSEEIVQTIFTKIYKLEKEKLPKESEASWLYSFSKNASLNFLRTKKDDLNIDEIYYIASECDELNEIIQKDTFNKIISNLNKKEQEIVSLKILSNLSFKEISQILDIPIGTVPWKYYKSLHTLKILLSSLSMYIVTIIVFIAQRNNNKTYKQPQKEESIKQEDNEQEDNEEKNQEETKKEETKKEETKKEETSGDTSRTEDIYTNTITEEYISVEHKENVELARRDIGLLAISTIFLTITIIFLTFFIRSQQKVNKKVSK